MFNDTSFPKTKFVLFISMNIAIIIVTKMIICAIISSVCHYITNKEEIV